jgi:hypothetical protein
MAAPTDVSRSSATKSQGLSLTLARTQRYFKIGDANDHVVLDGGRIMLHPQAPEGRPWF